MLSGSYTPEQAHHTAALHDNAPAGNQTDQPQHSEDDDRDEQQLGVVQKWEGIVPQEGDVGIVNERRQIERVTEEGS